MRIGLILRVAVIMLFAGAIIGEEAGKGSPIVFQAEVEKMLKILINSLYTQRAIFLREIISNASDALDKIRVLYLTNSKDPKNDAGEAPNMDIRIKVDREKRHFIMQDGGIGMTKEEMIAHLGSLGASGTKKFAETLKESSDANFIGQFGVGFYSVFLVADNIRVASKSDDSDKQWVWESSGGGSYFIFEDPRGNTLGRGTELTLELKADADEYLESDKIKEAIHKYSEFIHFPIYIQTTKYDRVPKKKDENAPEEEPKKDDANEDGEIKDDEEKKEEEFDTVPKLDWELVNENKPLWTRKPSEITDEEYNKFFKALTKDYDDPLYYTHFSAEGEVEFKSMLFVPGRAPYNIFDTSITHANIRLYVRRVFITDEFRDLLPRYLNFVKGIVDSDDLPLNVSREVLQESRLLKIIKKKLVRKALMMFQDIAASDKKIEEEAKEKKEGDEAKEEKDEEKEEKDESSGSKKLKEAVYPKFWEQFGKNLRLGMIEDGTNRARLTKLLRYYSSKSEEKLISFEDYVDRMPESQKSIFFLSGENIKKIKQSPVLEDAIKRDVEVIFMTDAIDEYVVGHVTEFSGKKLVNLAKEGVKFEDQSKREKKIDEKRKEKYEPLLRWAKNLVGEKVTKVIITKRKTSEPVILSSTQHGITARMGHIQKGQTLGNDQEQGGQASEVKQVLEINHLHPLMDEIYKRVKVDESDKQAEDAFLVLYEVAALHNGFDITETAAFSKRVNRLVRSGMDIASDAGLIEEDLNEYDVEEDVKEEEKEEGEKDGEKKEEL